MEPIRLLATISAKGNSWRPVPWYDSGPRSTYPLITNQTNSETTPQRSQCQWDVSVALGIAGPSGDIELRYDLYTRTIAASGSGLAARQLTEFRRQDGSAQMTLRKSSTQLGSDS
jgi:hypothetical protein